MFKNLEADKFLEEKMKLDVSKEYIKMLEKVLKSKLNGRNLVRGVNTWAVSLLRYSAAFVSWRKSELQAMDRKKGSCLLCMEHYTLSQLWADDIYLEKKEEEV